MWKNGNIPLVYLAGAIENAPDRGELWRKEISEFIVRELNHSVFNPCLEENHLLTREEFQNFRKWKTQDTPRFKQIVHKIIQNDIHTLIQKVDYVICRWDQYILSGGGTQGELTMAYWNQIPVYLWLGMPLQQVSSWMIGCTTEIFNDVTSLKKYLRKEYLKKP
jgi:hypothetical protein